MARGEGFIIGFSPIEGFIFSRNTPGITKTINSYIYSEYSDDDDLPAFIIAYNEMTQRYVDWLNYINLPIYTGNPIYGNILDWVAQGLYGISRPTLISGLIQLIGPYNTFGFNSGLAFGHIRRLGPTHFYLTTDDIFKRVITWHFYKGDGKQFSIRWLKRRIMRFLTGDNGTAGKTDQTYQVSVTFGVNHQANIRLLQTVRMVAGGAYNTFGFNSGNALNSIRTKLHQYSKIKYALIFKEAVDSGVLELPFQYDWNVVIVG